jgi:hypothetical protein
MAPRHRPLRKRKLELYGNGTSPNRNREAQDNKTNLKIKTGRF